MRLTIRHFRLSYGGIRALSDVSVEVPPGRISVLIGANGAGKSSLIRSIVGLESGDDSYS